MVLLPDVRLAIISKLVLLLVVPKLVMIVLNVVLVLVLYQRRLLTQRTPARPFKIRVSVLVLPTFTKLKVVLAKKIRVLVVELVQVV